MQKETTDELRTARYLSLDKTWLDQLGVDEATDLDVKLFEGKGSRRTRSMVETLSSLL